MKEYGYQLCSYKLLSDCSKIFFGKHKYGLHRKLGSIRLTIYIYIRNLNSSFWTFFCHVLQKCLITYIRLSSQSSYCSPHFLLQQSIEPPIRYSPVFVSSQFFTFFPSQILQACAAWSLTLPSESVPIVQPFEAYKIW